VGRNCFLELIGEEAAYLNSSGKEQLTFAASVRSRYNFSFERRAAYLSWHGKKKL
jgi:hypothetical protein